MTARRLPAALRRFHHDESGANALEFAIVGLPFIMLLLFGFQVGLYAMTQMALNTGVVKCAESLQAQFGAKTAPTLPSGAALKVNLTSNAGGLVINNGALAVEVRPLAGLSTTRTAISDQTVNYGAPHTVLAIRASFVTPTFVPGLNAVFTSYSSALVRRQNL